MKIILSALSIFVGFIIMLIGGVSLQAFLEESPEDEQLWVEENGAWWPWRRTKFSWCIIGTGVIWMLAGAYSLVSSGGTSTYH